MKIFGIIWNMISDIIFVNGFEILFCLVILKWEVL